MSTPRSAHSRAGTRPQVERLTPFPACLEHVSVAPGEGEADLQGLLRHVVLHLVPRDVLEMALAREYTDLLWDERRLRRIHDDALRLGRRQAATALLHEVIPSTSLVHSTIPHIVSGYLKGDPKRSNRLRALLAEHGYDEGTITSRAFLDQAEVLTRLQKQIEAHTRRRTRLLNDLHRHRTGFGTELSREHRHPQVPHVDELPEFTGLPVAPRRASDQTGTPPPFEDKRLRSDRMEAAPSVAQRERLQLNGESGAPQAAQVDERLERRPPPHSVPEDTLPSADDRVPATTAEPSPDGLNRVAAGTGDGPPYDAFPSSPGPTERHSPDSIAQRLTDYGFGDLITPMDEACRPLTSPLAQCRKVVPWPMNGKSKPIGATHA